MQNDTTPATESRFPAETVEYSGLSWVKTLIVLAVLFAIGLSIYLYIVANKPQARTFTPPKSVVSVEASTISLQDYPVKITANGTVAAVTRGNLVAQVSGEITRVSPNFASGGQFKQGEVLLEIDARNYASIVSNSSANFSQAKAALEQEKAEAEQALKDWQRLGFDGQPTDLVLRKPQLAAAQAQLQSAQAAYEKAQLDYSRTQVKAPYAGKIIGTNVDLGQFVSTGSVLGEIFSNQGLEIQLPLNQNQYSQLNIDAKPQVLLSAVFNGTVHRWPAQVVRSDSVFDTSTRQLNVIAKIDNPVSDQGLTLKIGQYVSAIIEGKIVEQALVIPNQSIREGSYVYLFDQGILRRRNISIIWQDDINSIVDGISAGDQVVSTTLGGAVNGASAQLVGTHSDQPENTTTAQLGGGNVRDLSPAQSEKMQKIRQGLGLKQGERPTPEQREKIRSMMREG